LWGLLRVGWGDWDGPDIRKATRGVAALRKCVVVYTPEDDFCGEEIWSNVYAPKSICQVFKKIFLLPGLQAGEISSAIK